MDKKQSLNQNKKSSSLSFPDSIIIIISKIIGGSGLLLFSYFLFAGGTSLIKLKWSAHEKIFLNILLSLSFFLQHSIMIRNRYKRWLSQFIIEKYHGPLFSISSGLLLLILVFFWQESVIILLKPHISVIWLSHLIFVIALLGIHRSVRALRSFDTLGIEPLLRHKLERQEKKRPFKVRGPYRWMRHPIYFFVLLMIWSYPVLTLDRLVFNFLWTMWIITGTLLEEQDLVSIFGKKYLEYQNKVPMLVPYTIQRKY